MSWETILKISTKHAIRDAKEFAPDMIREQEKLDREERDKGIALAQQDRKEKYNISPEELPRLNSFYFAPKASKTSGGVTSVNWESFLLSYVPYFITNEEFTTYKKNKIAIRKLSNEWNPDLPRWRRFKTENEDIVASASWRWYKHHTLEGLEK